ncbi:S-layer homology domain-containing protein [Sporomusa acidovorans]|uniref:SLH domain-containing protein n=1 Tax=Sporomusa acidovorans (strain ATCC 49682 / DSM 3132 / Mol) TaxID=1123286 RepID=A0ABZ3J5S6_SPOA4|nr:S-layer homology domain-containing protein [Sporomusa acidovorans]OZC21014.1 outer membrane protein alpha precursor [Sporomusa acidovorans DSM 3132]SDF18381.1 S-layer homology domain-containing protein [Sporomusa acidovorans]
MKKNKKLKKWLAIVPLALMSITMAGIPVVDNPVHAAAATASFSDVPADHWAYDAVGKLVKAGLVDGYTDKTFKGDRTMTRYEFAFIVAKAMDKFESADEANKMLIDKLSAEFAGELNRLGARVAKVESKTNTWVSGETRFRYMGNDPKAPESHKLRGSDKFDFRQRVKFQGTINEDISWVARVQATGKAGNYSKDNNDGTTASFDLFAVTAKNVFGIDKVRIGRFPYDDFTHGLFGKVVGVDGIRVDEGLGNLTFTGSVNNVKGNKNIANGIGDSGDAKTVTTAQLSGKFSPKFGWKAGYYWSDGEGSNETMNVSAGKTFASSKGWAVGIDTKIGDNLLLIGDYVSTNLSDAVNLSDSPKGWAVELTNATKQPPIFYGAKMLVDYKKPGDFGWSVSYRSIDAGAIPAGAGGFDAQAISYGSDKYSTLTKGSDNIKGLFVALSTTIKKNVVWTIEGQDLKFKNRKLTDATSDDLGKTYMTKIEFFY